MRQAIFEELGEELVALRQEFVGDELALNVILAYAREVQKRMKRGSLNEPTREALWESSNATILSLSEVLENLPPRYESFRRTVELLIDLVRLDV